MDVKEIRARRLTLLDELHLAQGEVDAIQARLRSLQWVCGHPNEFKTSHMGETCMHCPDCGHCP